MVLVRCYDLYLSFIEIFIIPVGDTYLVSLQG
nr:MAG TPA: hypothetical protein [Bacteriophage sp.]